MRLRSIVAGFLALPALCSALEVQPWFGDVFEFHFLSGYSFSWFNKVQGGRPQLQSPFHANVLDFGLEFCPSAEWSIDGDLQFASTTEPFRFRSTAMQLRYLWFDDVVGDPVTFATGVSGRATSSKALHDVSCPSHAHADFELNFSLGKEFDASESWRWRVWGFGAVGHGNRGSPWVRAIAAAETNINDQHRWALYAIGSNGYGRHSHVDLDHFRGYAKIRQKSIDAGIRYGCKLGVWGTLRFDYQRRILAKACPQQTNTFIVSYLLPFSL